MQNHYSINDIEQYKTTVSNYCNRILSEKRMSIHQYYENDRVVYSIKFSQPEWFTELDDDLKENIIRTMQNHYTNQVHQFIDEENYKNHNPKNNANYNRKRKHEETCCNESCECDDY